MNYAHQIKHSKSFMPVAGCDGRICPLYALISEVINSVTNSGRSVR